MWLLKVIPTRHRDRECVDPTLGWSKQACTCQCCRGHGTSHRESDKLILGFESVLLCGAETKGLERGGTFHPLIVCPVQ